MSFQLRGWHSQVIEVAYELVEDMPAFFAALNEPPLSMWVTLLPTAGAGPVMSPMVEGQGENLMWIRVDCPAHSALYAHVALHEALTQHFPRPPAG